MDDFTFVPVRFGIEIMRKVGQQVVTDTRSTNLIRDQHAIPLKDAIGIETFIPILEARIVPRRVRNTQGLMTIVRFVYSKNDQLVWSQLQPQDFEEEAFFRPDIAIPLSRQKREGIEGLWSIKAKACVIRTSSLANIAQARLIGYLEGLTYTEVAEFEWEIQAPVTGGLDATGMRTWRSPRPQNLTQSTLSADQI